MAPSDQTLRPDNPREALKNLQNTIRQDPATPRHRIYLFQLLCVLGQWDRALNQLNVLTDMDPEALAMVQTYQEALRCEAFRAEVFAGKRSPLMFGDPERWLALLLESLHRIAEGNHEQSAALRTEAFELAPASSGTLDGTPFQWIADADMRLGPVLEAIVNGQYYWIPFHRIQRVDFEEPVDLRDVVWLPAHFQWVNGGEAVGLIPTRYPGSDAHEDAEVQLAHKTLWQECPGDLYLGMGQRMLTTDTGEYPLLDCRQLLFDMAESEAETSTEGDPK